MQVPTAFGGANRRVRPPLIVNDVDPSQPAQLDTRDNLAVSFLSELLVLSHTLLPVIGALWIAASTSEPDFTCQSQSVACDRATIASLQEAAKCPAPAELAHAGAPVSPLPVRQCVDGQQPSWAGQCELKFGVDPALLSTHSACTSLYRHACGSYTTDQVARLGVPRGFAASQQLNNAILQRVQLIESMKPWSQDPWARLASSCTAGVAQVDEAGGEWLRQQLEHLVVTAQRNPARALLDAQLLGAAPFLTIDVKQNPVNRSQTMLYLQSYINFDVSELLHTRPTSRLSLPNSVWDAFPTARQRQAQVFLTALARMAQSYAMQLSDDRPRTLYGYALRTHAPSLELDVFEWTDAPDNELAAWAVALRTAHPVLQSSAGVWAYDSAFLRSLCAHADSHRQTLAAYLVASVLRAYVTRSETDASTTPDADMLDERALVQKMANAPPYAHAHRLVVPSQLVAAPVAGSAWDVWDSECAHFASQRVWWRVDRWFQEAQAQRSVHAKVREVFTHVQRSLIHILNASTAPVSLRAKLVTKLQRVRLRYGAHVPEPYTVASDLTERPTSWIRELAALHNSSLQRFQSRPYEDRVVDAVDLPTFTSNAFYSATDNTLTVFTGLLSGAFYATEARAHELLPTLGAVIGHELAHAVDSRGIWYDWQGNVAVPANRDTIAAYLRTFRCIVEQMAAQGLQADLVMDEAFADALGLLAASHAWTRAHTQDTRKFFTQYAQLWCGQMPDTGAAQWVRAYGEDEHPPPQTRVDFAAAAAGAMESFACGAASIAQTCRPLL